MADRTDIPVCRFRRPARRGGFSFAEVLFAVIILGIGFILVAAIFPVAIQQTQATGEDAAAVLAARGAAAVITTIPGQVPNPVYTYFNVKPPYPTGTFYPPATLAVFPPTVKNFAAGTTVGSVPPAALVVPFAGPRFDAVRGSLVGATDGRYAYVPFYRRETGSPTAQLIVFAVAVRDQTAYAPNTDLATDVDPQTRQASATYPATVKATTKSGNLLLPAVTAPPALTTVYADTVKIDQSSVTVDYRDEGKTVAYIPPTYAYPPGQQWQYAAAVVGRPGGRTYQMGRFLSDTTFELEPADGLTLGAGTAGPWGTVGAAHDVELPSEGHLLLHSRPVAAAVPAYARGIFAAPGSAGGRIMLSDGMPSATGSATTNVVPVAATPGAFVIIGDDFPYDLKNPQNPSYTLPVNTTVGNVPISVGMLNGRIFRLGQPVPADSTAVPPVYPGTFELDPAYGMRPATATVGSPDVIPLPFVDATNKPAAPAARVFIVGGSGVNASGVATGSAQGIGVYSTYFPVP